MTAPAPAAPSQRRRGAAWIVGFLAALGLLYAAPVAAEEGGAWTWDPGFELHGRFRYRHTDLTDFPLDADGTPYEASSWGTALLRFYPELRLTRGLYLRADFQVLDGQFHGDQRDLGGDGVLRPWRNAHIMSQARIREAWAHIPIGIGALRVGRMASHWGLGMLANSGDDDRYAFGDATHGDISNRLMFLTRPLAPFSSGRAADALALVLAVDLVEQDELTDRLAGDRAVQAVGALAWREEGFELGAYVAWRRLRTDEGELTKAIAADLFWRWHPDVGDGWRLRLAAEGAVITGTTEQARFEGAQFPVDILQFGAAFEGDLTATASGLGFALQAGFASGDNSTQDGTARAFRFDPAYKVGLILYDEVLARLSARAHDRVRDPELVGSPPDGSDLLPTNGSVTNTIYVNPQLFWAPGGGVIDARVGFLLALAAGDVVDAFATAEAGGFNRSYYGKRNAGGVLGYEVDAGFEVDLERFGALPELGPFTLRPGFQYGVFIAGPALQGGAGVTGAGTVHKWRFLLDLSW